MSYCVQKLDRSICGPFKLFLQAWDECKALLSRGHRRVAICSFPGREILFVMGGGK